MKTRTLKSGGCSTRQGRPPRKAAATKERKIPRAGRASPAPTQARAQAGMPVLRIDASGYVKSPDHD